MEYSSAWNLITNKKQMSQTHSINEKALIGLFATEKMPYIDERIQRNQNRRNKIPSFPEMVKSAISTLKNNSKEGFFLLAEGGLIDTAHHANQANRAILETVEFDQAIQETLQNLTETEKQETLIIVTADHGHTFTYGGWGHRGSQVYHESPGLQNDYLMSYNNNGYTIGGYYNGPSKSGSGTDPSRPDYVFKSATNNIKSDHSGEDVPIYANGPFAHLLKGTHEQSYINYVMQYASCVSDLSKGHRHCR